MLRKKLIGGGSRVLSRNLGLNGMLPFELLLVISETQGNRRLPQNSMFRDLKGVRKQ